MRGDEALEFVELVGDFFAGHPVLLANDFAVVGGGGIPVFHVNRAGFGEAGELAEGIETDDGLPGGGAGEEEMTAAGAGKPFVCHICRERSTGICVH